MNVIGLCVVALLSCVECLGAGVTVPALPEGYLWYPVDSTGNPSGPGVAWAGGIFDVSLISASPFGAEAVAAASLADAYNYYNNAGNIVMPVYDYYVSGPSAVSMQVGVPLGDTGYVGGPGDVYLSTQFPFPGSWGGKLYQGLGGGSVAFGGSIAAFSEWTPGTAQQNVNDISGVIVSADRLRVPALIVGVVCLLYLVGSKVVRRVIVVCFALHGFGALGSDVACTVINQGSGTGYGVHVYEAPTCANGNAPFGSCGSIGNISGGGQATCTANGWGGAGNVYIFVLWYNSQADANAGINSHITSCQSVNLGTACSVSFAAGPVACGYKIREYNYSPVVQCYVGYLDGVSLGRCCASPGTYCEYSWTDINCAQHSLIVKKEIYSSEGNEPGLTTNFVQQASFTGTGSSPPNSTPDQNIADSGFNFPSATNDMTGAGAPFNWYDKTNTWDSGLALDSSVKQGDAALYAALKDMANELSGQGVAANAQLNGIANAVNANGNTLSTIAGNTTAGNSKLDTLHGDMGTLEGKLDTIAANTASPGASAAQISAANGIYSISNGVQLLNTDMLASWLQQSNAAYFGQQGKLDLDSQGNTLLNIKNDADGMVTQLGNVNSGISSLQNSSATTASKSQEIANNTAGSKADLDSILSQLQILNATAVSILSTNGQFDQDMQAKLSALGVLEATNFDGIKLNQFVGLQALTNIMSELSNQVAVAQSGTNYLAQIAANTAGGLTVSNYLSVSNNIALTNMVSVSNQVTVVVTNQGSGDSPQYNIPDTATNADAATAAVTAMLGTELDGVGGLGSGWTNSISVPGGDGSGLVFQFCGSTFNLDPDVRFPGVTNFIKCAWTVLLLFAFGIFFGGLVVELAKTAAGMQTGGVPNLFTSVLGTGFNYTGVVIAVAVTTAFLFLWKSLFDRFLTGSWVGHVQPGSCLADFMQLGGNGTALYLLNKSFPITLFLTLVGLRMTLPFFWAKLVFYSGLAARYLWGK